MKQAKQKTLIIVTVIAALHLIFLAGVFMTGGCSSPQVLQDRSYIPAPTKEPRAEVFSENLPQSDMDIAVPLPPTSAPEPLTYTVKSGDSFWKIGRIYGVSKEELASENNMSLDKPLRIGAVLRIPPGGALIPEDQLPPITKKNAKTVPSATSYEPRPEDGTYIVKAGDSLWKIASKYNLKTSTLAEANNLDIKKPLQIGQKLIIPGSTGVTTTSVASEEASLPEEGKESPDFLAEESAAKESAPDESLDTLGIPDKTESPAGIEDVDVDVELPVEYSPHEVIEGETVETIAELYNLKAEDIRKANPDLPAEGKLTPFTTIKIPTTP